MAHTDSSSVTTARFNKMMKTELIIDEEKQVIILQAKDLMNKRLDRLKSGLLLPELVTENDFKQWMWIEARIRTEKTGFKVVFEYEAKQYLQIFNK